MTGAERSRAWRQRRAARRTAEELDSPALVDRVQHAIRSPELVVHVPLREAMAEVRTFLSAWFARGLGHPPTPDQYAQGLDALVVRGAGTAAAAAMDSVPRRGTTYRAWGAGVRAGAAVAARTGAWAAAWLAQLGVKGRRPPLPVSPPPVTESLSVHARPPERPPDRVARSGPTSLGELMAGLGLADHFTDRARR